MYLVFSQNETRTKRLLFTPEKSNQIFIKDVVCNDSAKLSNDVFYFEMKFTTLIQMSLSNHAFFALDEIFNTQNVVTNCDLDSNLFAHFIPELG